MARSDLIVNLVKASSKGDKDMFIQTVEAIIVEERSKQHHSVADKLSTILTLTNNSKLNFFNETDSSEVSELIKVKTPTLSLADLQLDEKIRSEINDLVEENSRIDLLRSYDLEPRHKVLLTGAPGNGKTSLAEALAEALMVPMYTIRYENLIGSYLGETAQRISKVIDFVKERRCVLFFDEFDAVGKERGDTHETGEIKRVVNSLLLQLDGLPSHVMLVAASNHPELLDKAAWRRFQVKLELDKPTPVQIKKWFEDFAKNTNIPIKISLSLVNKSFSGSSYSDLREFCLDLQRKIVLSQPKANVDQIFKSRLERLNLKKKNK